MISFIQKEQALCLSHLLAITVLTLPALTRLAPREAILSLFQPGRFGVAGPEGARGRTRVTLGTGSGWPAGGRRASRGEEYAAS